MFVAWWPGAYSCSSLFPNSDLGFARSSRDDVTHGEAAEEGVQKKCRKHKVQVFLRGVVVEVHRRLDKIVQVKETTRGVTISRAGPAYHIRA